MNRKLGYGAQLPMDCLSCSRGDSGLPRGGWGQTGKGSFGGLPRVSNSRLKTGMDKGETTAKGTGLAKSAGKEDPVELNSSTTL
ncbi:hypothetical protein AgCh_033903 [Apium graveolens]